MEETIGDYRFVQIGDNSIHVYRVDDSSRPVLTIVPEGYIITEKDFQMEIMDWYSKNIS